MTNKELIEIVPRFKSGPNKGEIRNERLKEIHSMLHKYQFTQEELAMLEEEVWHHTPKRKSRMYCPRGHKTLPGSSDSNINPFICSQCNHR